MWTHERLVHHSKYDFGMYRSNLIGNFTHGGANGFVLLLISTLHWMGIWWDARISKLNLEKSSTGIILFDSLTSAKDVFIVIYHTIVKWMFLDLFARLETFRRDSVAPIFVLAVPNRCCRCGRRESVLCMFFFHILRYVILIMWILMLSRSIIG